MGYHPRIECKKIGTFQTTRTRRSELWFVNNAKLEGAILGYAAKYAKSHEVKLYAFAIEGNHIHFPALFPRGNRSSFMRNFNSMVARSVPRYQKMFPGGGLWERRYSAEYLPGYEDIEEQFFYTVLQAVQDCLVDDIRHNPAYNCFEDAINGTTRTYKVIRWKEFNDAKRWDPGIDVENFTDCFDLTFERLPGYEHLTQQEYASLMRTKLKERTARLLKQRGGKKAMGVVALKRVRPGSRPHKSKMSHRYSHRPRVLSKDPDRRAQGKSWYFSIYRQYRRASMLYRSGADTYSFPLGTYKPPAFTIIYPGDIPWR